MLKKTLLSLIPILLFSGCAGLGFDKRATLMPDTVGIYYETGPVETKSYSDFECIKVGVRSDWKFMAPVLKEKK